MKFIVLTGGPGAGKTAVLELAKKQLGPEIAVLPEAASIVFGGGFWRLSSPTATKAAQRAIYHIQMEMETLVTQEGKWSLGICDRGTIDGLAYWPGTEETFWTSLKTTRDAEFAKYRAVIHLRTPSSEFGYNHQNPIRIETAQEAFIVDSRISQIWSSHPRYYEVPSTLNFLDKAKLTLELINSTVQRETRTPTSIANPADPKDVVKI